MTSTYRLATASCALGVLTYAGVMSLVSANKAAADGAQGPPATLELTGVVRDFREHTVDEGGHPDFEVLPDHGFGHYCGNIAASLGADGKPVFTGDGHRVTAEWKDAQGRKICYHVAEAYPLPTDNLGAFGPADTGGIESEGSFNQWYRDVQGINMSKLLTITLVRQDDGTYVFDDELDPLYDAMGGFFPIEDQLLGNPGGSPDRNFHFTYELHSTFVYNSASNQIFKFIGDDDVWVFINGELVIDIGGVHAAVEQFIDLTRLGLTSGQTYQLDFFFAERHRTQSNFRIVTNLELESIDPPSTITAIYD